MKFNDIYIFVGSVVTFVTTFVGGNYHKELSNATGLDWSQFFTVMGVSSAILFLFSVFLAKSFLSEVRATGSSKKVIFSYILVTLAVASFPLMFILASLNS